LCRTCREKIEISDLDDAIELSKATQALTSRTARSAYEMKPRCFSRQRKKISGAVTRR
jgi:hypothetical protein